MYLLQEGWCPALPLPQNASRVRREGVLGTPPLYLRSSFMRGGLMIPWPSGMDVVGLENWTETSSNLAKMNTQNSSDMLKIWTFVTGVRRVRAGNSERFSLVLIPFRSNDFRAGVEPPRSVAGIIGWNIGPPPQWSVAETSRHSMAGAGIVKWQKVCNNLNGWIWSMSDLNLSVKDLRVITA